MSYYIVRQPYPNELYHHGIKGQKWGVRRYQNPDGSLTAAGKRRYVSTARKEYRELEERASMTGRIVEKTRKQAIADDKKSYMNLQKHGFKSIKDYDEAVKAGTVSKKVQSKIDKGEAKALDSDIQNRIWSIENQRVKEALNKYKTETNKKLEEYGKKPLKDIPTKTLKTGEEIVKGRILNAGDYATAAAITGGTIATRLLTGAPVALISVPSASKKADSYQHRREFEIGYYPYQAQAAYKRHKKQGYYK